jgi:1-deoxy-D-xylulose-5-phosphate reductoisomerase
MIKNIFLLGSTGSIGRNTVDVVRQHPDHFRIDLLLHQIEALKPERVIIYDRDAYQSFARTTHRENLKILHGREGILDALASDKYDLFLNAFVGFAGLEPTVSAIKQGIDVAIANKETLVVAGALINELVGKTGVRLLPIDSEHSAIWQCLAGEDKESVRRLIITASGGPFRKKRKSELTHVTPQEALKHPNWKMGNKITIDSATMMNKGLEIIEAFWLYGLPLNKIEVLVHPQSVIHSMVEFKDRSVKAQLGLPDMRIPIQYALSYPERLDLDVPEADFTKIGRLDFEPPDPERFPCLRLASEAISSGDTYPAALNAANEVAVEAFLKKMIKFTDIPVIVEEILRMHKPLTAGTLENFITVDAQTREEAGHLIKLKQI